MKKRFVIVLSVLAAAALFSACSDKESAPIEQAQAPAGGEVVTREVARTVKPDYTIRLAYLDAGTWPDVTKAPLPEHAFGLVFKSIVESNSNEKIAVELFPNNQLGDTKATMEMTITGSIEMVITTGTAASLYPELQVFFLPYVFKSDEIAWDIFDNSRFWRDMSADFEKRTGLTILGAGQNGTRHFTNSKRPIHTPADMKGLKFRVMQSPIYVKMVEAMGAQATPLASGEVYTACQTGVVDGQENPVWNIAANKWYEVQKYITLDGHVWSENFVMINTNYFNSLPKEYQHIIRIATYHAIQADRAAEDLASRVLDFAAIQSSMEVYVPTAAELEEFKKAAAPTYDWLRGEIGDEVVDKFLAAVKESEQKFGY
ncbi:MAG: DctP family TRAP transporter solute-binding subunit [Spirochaetaceae bacterium]|jgi:C4-dicarboxylate-binding protein DctP|nr:DctP family TRAP transporter solute-binding subunit [Spirochaetaceae bacterium]